MLLLLIAVDVHLNPGTLSIVRHISRLCNKRANIKKRPICCDLWDLWLYINCVRAKKFDALLEDPSMRWICDEYGSSNFSRHFLSSISDIPSNNYYRLFSDQVGLPTPQSIPIASDTSLTLEYRCFLTSELILTASVNHLLSQGVQLKQFTVDNEIDML